MRNSIILFIVLLICTSFNEDNKTKKEYQEITITTVDGVDVTADLYLADTAKSKEIGDFIILCHQENSSRGEYREIALKFKEMGYNCLALDLRSERGPDDVINKTYLDATKKKKPIGYMNAKRDITASISYILKEYKKESILLGNSNSASLVLLVAKDGEAVKGVVAFSPVEYIPGNDDKVAHLIKGFDLPVFLTGTEEELPQFELFTTTIMSDNMVLFIPSEGAVHGIEGLKPNNPSSDMYWETLIPFLDKL